MKYKIVLTEDEILAICHRIGGELTNKLKNEERLPLFLGVMKGALNFMFDLIQRAQTLLLKSHRSLLPPLVYL